MAALITVGEAAGTTGRDFGWCRQRNVSDSSRIKSNKMSSVITIATDLNTGRYRRVLDINGRMLRPFCKGMIGGADIALIAALKEERTQAEIAISSEAFG